MTQHILSKLEMHFALSPPKKKYNRSFFSSEKINETPKKIMKRRKNSINYAVRHDIVWLWLPFTRGDFVCWVHRQRPPPGGAQSRREGEALALSFPLEFPFICWPGRPQLPSAARTVWRMKVRTMVKANEFPKLRCGSRFGGDFFPCSLTGWRYWRSYKC